MLTQSGICRMQDWDWVGSPDTDSLASAGQMLRQYTKALQTEASQREQFASLLRGLLGAQVSSRRHLCFLQWAGYMLEQEI